METQTKVFEPETQAIDINGHRVYVSLLHVHSLPHSKEEERALVAAVHMQLAQELRAQPGIENQKTACLITNGVPVIERMGVEEVKAFVEQWFNQSEEQDAASQRYFYELFGMPTITINVLSGIPTEFFTGRYEAINSSANVPYFVNSMSEAIELATKLLRIAHRY